MEPTKFDDLTKALATSTSRRKALRRIGGILGGTALAGWLPGVALASNSNCAHFCASVFGANTPAAKQCTSDAAHNTGLCHQCGSVVPSSICCSRNASGYCSSYTGAFCPCPSGQTCQNGQCVTSCPPAPACNDTCPCPSGQVCQSGVCVFPCLQQSCTSPGDCCGSDSGQVTCTNTGCTASNVFVCCSFGACSSDCDCCGGTCDPTTHMCTCFTAGTLVAMADGTSRPIEHTQVGDLVLGNAGRINRVTEVLLPLLGNRPLYSLNGSNYFVTSGHPFMTEGGWKAVDPSAVPAQLSELHVNRLTVGDRLLALTAAAVPVGGGRTTSAEAVDVRIEAIALQSLVAQPADPATQLYNLRLDGDHTYFANGLLVHNK